MRAFIATTCRPDDRKTLCAVRALALSGAAVTVGGDRFLGEAFYSRFMRKRFRYPHPNADMEGFVECLLRHLADGDYDVLLPMCDYTTMAVSTHLQRFGSCVHAPVPGHESLLRTLDKLRTIQLARQLGIAVPATHCVHDSAALVAIAEKMSYPCVMKPRQGAGAVGVVFPSSPADLAARYSSLPTGTDLVYAYDRPLVQELVPGEVHDVCLLFNRGRARAALTQKRLKMYPLRGGVGILNETTDEPVLKEQAITLLEAMNWHGPAMVEFKVDSRDGTPVLMEVNGRFWGTLDLSVRAGMNFPLMACRMAIDGDIASSFQYRIGLRYRWAFPLGLLHAMETDGGPATLWEFLRPEKGSVSDLRLSDPLPALAEAFYIARRAWSRRSLRPPRSR